MLGLSQTIAAIAIKLPISRIHIARCNIAHCFSELTEREQYQLLKMHLRDLVMGFFETGIAWWWPVWRINRNVSIEGLENLTQLQGQPCLVLAGHFTHLEIGASMILKNMDYDGMYRKNKNAVLEWLQICGRTRYYQPFDKKTERTDFLMEMRDLKTIIRNLKQGRAMWYAPDQDMGANRSVFAPFMGQTAASISATSRIVKITGANTVPMTQVRTNEGYKVIVFPKLENFPTGDAIEDATIINQVIEKFVRLQPSAYLWVHRRFKTQPDNFQLYKRN